MALTEKGKPTPGPWRIGYGDGSGSTREVSGITYESGVSITVPDAPGSVKFRDVVSGGHSDGLAYGVLRDEDANLIAQAPALLKFAEDVLQYVTTNKDTAIAIRRDANAMNLFIEGKQIIAKVYERPVPPLLEAVEELVNAFGDDVPENSTGEERAAWRTLMASLAKARKESV